MTEMDDKENNPISIINQNAKKATVARQVMKKNQAVQQQTTL